ncbi:hypothetical protein M407DRAFT_243511, partial [Tulasnella calospora MUT 4182]
MGKGVTKTQFGSQSRLGLSRLQRIIKQRKGSFPLSTYFYVASYNTVSVDHVSVPFHPPVGGPAITEVRFSPFLHYPC